MRSPDALAGPATSAGDRTADGTNLALRRWATERGPWIVVAGTVALNLWILRGESLAVQNLNDSALHATLVRWAAAAIRSGHIPLDDWFPLLTGGSPVFQGYQSTGHIITGFAATLFGGDRTFAWTNYLLLATWPVSIYLAARFFGLTRWAAAAAAAVSPLAVSAPGYGYESGSYMWRGLGVFAQLWGMWALPLALGLAWRAIEHRRSHVAAALALALTAALHYRTGYFGVLAIGVMVLVRPSELLARAGRAAIVSGGGVLIAGYKLLPLVGGGTLGAESTVLSGFWNDSFGAPKVLGWLVRGDLYDSGRFPVVSILVAVGALACIVRFRRDARARVLLSVFALALALFIGRPTLGFVLDLLPASGGLLFMRFITAVHLTGFLLAGYGTAWAIAPLVPRVRAWLTSPQLRLRGPAQRVAPALAVTVAIVIGALYLSPAWRERHRFAAEGASWVRMQHVQDRTSGAALARLIDVARERGGGRIYAGLPTNWGAQYKVGFVPVYASLLNNDAEGIGFTYRVGSPMTQSEAYFNEANASHYAGFGVRYVMMPRGRKPPVEATVLAADGPHTLWEVTASSGLVVVADTFQPQIEHDTFLKTALGALAGPAAAQGRYAAVQRPGLPAPDLTWPASDAEPGSITRTERAKDGSVVTVRVDANREAAVIAKVSYTPRWTAIVDGREVRPYMVAPGLPAVTVPAGEHEVVFRYRSYGFGPAILFGLLALAALIVYDRRRRPADPGFRDPRPAPEPAPMVAARSPSPTPAPTTTHLPPGHAPPAAAGADPARADSDRPSRSSDGLLVGVGAIALFAIGRAARRLRNRS